MIVARRNYYLVFLYMSIIQILFLNTIQGQLCEGNTSEVLFLETFGSGDNFGPELASGVTTYNYGSIGDGNYVVTNTTGLNGPLWHNSLDHTENDTDGYMLLFDASLASETFYRNSFTGLCENTDYVFSCFVANIVTPSACSGSSIEPSLRFRILDPITNQELGFADTGLIPTTSQLVWVESAITFSTLANQDAVTIEVINIASGGCGNDLVIDDFSLRRCDPIEEITEDLCDSESGVIQIDGFTLLEPGMYQYEIPIANSCNIKFVKLNIEGEKVVNQNVVVKFCAGDTILSNGFEIFQDSLILDTLSFNDSCPEIDRFEFIAQETSFTSVTIYLCNDESVQIGDNTYFDSILFIDTLSSEIGCDSIVDVQIIKTQIEIDDTGVQSVIEVGDEVQMQANSLNSDIEDLFWSPNEDLSCNQCLDPIFSPTAPGVEVLFLIDSLTLCSDSIQFLIEPCNVDIFLPNAFSPNDDRINDEFVLLANDCVLSINFIKVFDRWGNLVCDNKSLDPLDVLWDGYFGQKLCKTGVYIYILEVDILGSNSRIISGDLTLMN